MATPTEVARMTRFLVKAKTPTALRLPKPRELTFPNVAIRVSNWENADEAGPVHRGLFFDVVLDDESLDAAFGQVDRMLDGIASMFAYTDCVAVGKVDVLIAYEYEDGSHDRSVLQRTPVAAGTAGSRLQRTDSTRAVLDRMLRLDAKTRDRVDRAMAWYRKALASEFTLDRFAACWTGLQAVDPVLVKKHNIEKEQVIRACEKCGNEVVTFPGMEGARQAVLAVGDLELWKRINRVRNDFLHSREMISEVVTGANEVQHAMARALFFAIADALDVPESELGPRTPMGLPVPQVAEVRFVLASAPLDAIRFGSDYPQVHVVNKVVEGTTEATGVQETTQQTYVLSGFEGSWGELHTRVSLYHDPDSPPKLVDQQQKVLRAANDTNSAPIDAE